MNYAALSRCFGLSAAGLVAPVAFAAFAASLAACSSSSTPGGQGGNDAGTKADARTRDGTVPRGDAGSSVDATADAPADGSPTVLPGPCVTGTVTFRMEVPGVDGGYTAITSEGDPGDGVWWYSIATKEGDAVDPFVKPGDTLCKSCSGAFGMSGTQCNFIPDGGETATWGGATVTTGMCKGSDECDVLGCAPAGEYVVTMCATPFSVGLCALDGGQTCVKVPFTYPATTDVVGQIPAG
jgi:hypothetical protein